MIGALQAPGAFFFFLASDGDFGIPRPGQLLSCRYREPAKLLCPFFFFLFSPSFHCHT